MTTIGVDLAKNMFQREPRPLSDSISCVVVRSLAEDFLYALSSTPAHALACVSVVLY